MRFIRFFVFFCALSAPAPRAGAEELLTPAVKTQIQELQQTVEMLRASMQDLKKIIASQGETIHQQGIRIQALEGGGLAAPRGHLPEEVHEHVRGLNPAIGVVGTVQAELTESTEDGEGRDTIALRELELRLEQHTSSHSRVEAVLAFNDNLEPQNVDIEEAYYENRGLPLGFTGRVGKFRAQAGKQNRLALHQLDTVDYPLVIQDFFGEEGMSASGGRLQNTLPNPWDIPLELTGEVFRGNAGESFSGVSRRPVFNVHVSSFFEPTNHTSIEIGGTAMFGDENTGMTAKGEDHYGVHIFGGDVTFLWRLENERSLKYQSEIYYQDRSSLVTPNGNPWGFYQLLDYRFLPRWSAGVRFDYLEPRGTTGGHGRTTAVSPYLTFWQSDFANFRLQYRHLEPAAPEEKSDDAVLLQATFMMGEHEHHIR